MKNKNHKWTFEEVLTKFEKIEKELNLDKSTIQGVHWWDMLRLQIFNELLNELGLKKEKKKNETLTIFEYFRIKILLIVVFIYLHLEKQLNILFWIFTMIP